MSKRISKDLTKSLLSGQIQKRDDLKLSDYDSTEYFLLSNGQLLLDFKDADYSALFDSIHEYSDFINTAAQKGRSHILEGFPNTEDDFISSIQTSKESLQIILGISNLDFSFMSLERIDEALQRLKFTYHQYLSEIFILLVPYVSQTVIKEKNGKWKFKLDKPSNVIEPHILLPDGRLINVFIDLYEEAMEHYDDFSVYSTAYLRLDTF